MTKIKPTIQLLDENEEIKAVFVLDAKPMTLKQYEKWDKEILKLKNNMLFGVRKV